ncbi:hypothetical protein QBC39DRAFT_65546 [Podospora conica]|nr:hypothetical protein QBC39DRAFT_65546 [Schizothecium conicum]
MWCGTRNVEGRSARSARHSDAPNSTIGDGAEETGRMCRTEWTQWRRGGLIDKSVKDIAQCGVESWWGFGVSCIVSRDDDDIGEIEIRRKGTALWSWGPRGRRVVVWREPGIHRWREKDEERTRWREVMYTGHVTAKKKFAPPYTVPPPPKKPRERSRPTHGRLACRTPATEPLACPERPTWSLLQNERSGRENQKVLPGCDESADGSFPRLSSTAQQARRVLFPTLAHRHFPSSNNCHDMRCRRSHPLREHHDASPRQSRNATLGYAALDCRLAVLTDQPTISRVSSPGPASHRPLTTSLTGPSPGYARDAVALQSPVSV